MTTSPFTKTSEALPTPKVRTTWTLTLPGGHGVTLVHDPTYTTLGTTITIRLADAQGRPSTQWVSLAPADTQTLRDMARALGVGAQNPFWSPLDQLADALEAEGVTGLAAGLPVLADGEVVRG